MTTATTASEVSRKAFEDLRNPRERLLKLTSVDGILLPAKSLICDRIPGALRYQARPGDIFLATYPKAGATWTQYILWTIFNLDKVDEPLPSFDDLVMNRIPFLELVGREVVEKLPEPRIIKHHLKFSKSPYHPQSKYLVIVRNPFDCVVSFYHHSMLKRDVMDIPSDATFEDFFEEFMDGNVPYGYYFDHVLSWYSHRNDPNVLFFYYERMKQNPAEGILKIAEFLDASVADRLREDPSLLSAVIKATSFKNMKPTAPITDDVCPEDDGDEPDTLVPRNNFFRKGTVGDWKDYLKTDQERRLRDECEKQLQGTEMWETWKEFLGYSGEDGK